jgi:hypothetical protein
VPSLWSTTQGSAFSMPLRAAVRRKTLAGQHEVKQIDEDAMTDV